MQQDSLITLGWREWLALPGLGIDRIKAKVDTGARTSALHAFEIEPFAGEKRLRFRMHPLQRDSDTVADCVADIVDRRIVSDSGGHRELRWVIETEQAIGSYRIWPLRTNGEQVTLFSMDTILLTRRSSHTNRPGLTVLGDMALTPARLHELCGMSRHMLAMMVAAKTQGPVFWISPAWGSDRLNPDGMRAMVDPARSYLVGRKPLRKARAG